MAKTEPHKSKDIPEMTKIVKQAQAEVLSGTQPKVTKAPIKNPNATTRVHETPQ